MALSSKTIQSLCKVITPEVIEEIFSSDAYVEFMMQTIPNVIHDKMGELDDELLGELSFMVFENINLVPTSKVSQWGLGTHKNPVYTVSVPMDPFLSNSQIEELEDFWTLEEDELSYDDESFEQLLDTSHDFWVHFYG